MFMFKYLYMFKYKYINICICLIYVYINICICLNIFKDNALAEESGNCQEHRKKTVVVAEADKTIDPWTAIATLQKPQLYCPDHAF